MIPRKIASTDRHYDLGAAIANGKRSDELGTGKQPLEGVVTAQAAIEVARLHGIELPLVQAVDKLCHDAEECDPGKCSPAFYVQIWIWTAPLVAGRP